MLSPDHKGLMREEGRRVLLGLPAIVGWPDFAALSDAEIGKMGGDLRPSYEFLRNK